MQGTHPGVFLIMIFKHSAKTKKTYKYKAITSYDNKKNIKF